MDMKLVYIALIGLLAYPAASCFAEPQSKKWWLIYIILLLPLVVIFIIG